MQRGRNSDSDQHVEGAVGSLAGESAYFCPRQGCPWGRRSALSSALLCVASCLRPPRGRLAAPAQSCRCSITRAPERAQDVCRGSCHSLIRALIGPMGGHMPEPQ